MATTTTNFGWDIPQSTDLVKDGATAIAALGQDIDTAMVDLKGGTTGQVLAKASGADLDFSWVAQDDSNAIQNAIVDAKGDLIAATANDTPARLAVGTNGHVLTADSTAATGLKWAAPAAGAYKLIKSQAIGTGVSSVTVSDAFTTDYDSYDIIISGGVASTGPVNMQFQLGSTTTGYSYSLVYATYASSVAATIVATNGANFPYTGSGNTNSLATHIRLVDPFATKWTKVSADWAQSDAAGAINGFLQNTTSYTAFTMTPSGATLTGGTIYVYGRSKS